LNDPQTPCGPVWATGDLSSALSLFGLISKNDVQSLPTGQQFKATVFHASSGST